MDQISGTDLRLRTRISKYTAIVQRITTALFNTENIKGLGNRRVAELRVASCELRVASCELRVASCELRVASCELRVASCELRVASCELRVASCELRVASCELRVASCELLVADSVPQQYYLTAFSKL